MKPLDKIVNTIRISPHGITASIIGTGMILDRVCNLGIYDSLPEGLKPIYNVSFGQIFGVSSFLANGIPKYFKTKKLLKKSGIDKRHVEKNLVHYCDRQAYKAAAYECGMGKQFDEINKNYEGGRHFKWMPEI
ncbi:MAG: hypothetical protein Q8Q04_00925 [archaeon]|nr:hypothetical protein [archaeon]